MIITIHQPEHLIWLGLVKKISDADVVVFSDNNQYVRQNFHNRNKIKNKDGWMWLTVPVAKHSVDTEIRDIEISYDQDWVSKYLNAIKFNYGKSEYFDLYFPDLEKIILKKHKYLFDLKS